MYVSINIIDFEQKNLNYSLGKISFWALRFEIGIYLVLGDFKGTLLVPEVWKVILNGLELKPT